MLKWKHESGVCRCCLVEGSYKNLSECFYWMQEREIYAEMLRDVFDISLLPAEGEQCVGFWSICDACIARLRDANAFKRQVLASEVRFREEYHDHIIKSQEPEIKSEPEDVSPKVEAFSEAPVDDDDIDNAFNSDDDDSKNIKVEIQDTQPVAKKRGRPKGKTNSKKKPTKTKKAKSKVEKADTEESQPEGAEPEEAEPDGAELEGPSEPKKKKGAYVEGVDFKTLENGRRQCNRCNKMFASSFTVRNHLKYYHDKIPCFPCSMCPENFVWDAQRIKHMHLIHDITPKTFPCLICGKYFTRADYLDRHNRSVHLAEKNFKCNLCEYTCFDRNGLKSHYITHKPVEDYYCQYCDKILHRKVTYDLHVRMHSGESKYCCEICDKAYAMKSTLDVHIQRFHSEGVPARKRYQEGEDFILKGNGKVSCSRCKKDYKNKRDVYKHIKSSHDNDSNMTCDLCDETFYSKTHLNKHKHMKHSIKPEVTCPMCNSIFFTRTSLLLHQRAEHSTEKRYKCNQCAYRTFTKRSWLIHVEEHKAYQCDYCNIFIKHKKALLGHIKSHLISESLVCWICNKKFYKFKNMMEHIRKHPEFDEDVCEFCKEDFSTSGDIFTHLKEYHSDKLKRGMMPVMMRISDTAFVDDVKNKQNEHDVSTIEIKLEPSDFATSSETIFGTNDPLDTSSTFASSSVVPLQRSQMQTVVENFDINYPIKIEVIAEPSETEYDGIADTNELAQEGVLDLSRH